MLVLKDINVTLGKGTKLERHVLKNLNLVVEDGEFVIVIGGNGAGKSTMFNVIAGALRPDSGKVIINHKDLTKLSQAAHSKVIARVMQDPRVGTMENMSILENMAFAYKRGSSRGLSLFASKTRKKLFQEKLSILGLGLEHRLDELVLNLSGGQRQALSLIMAIIADSKILLLDEIAAALDPKTAAHVMQIANKIVREEKRSCIMITHNMAHAVEYGDRTIVLHEGRFTKEFNVAAKKHLTTAQLASEFGEV